MTQDMRTPYIEFEYDSEAEFPATAKDNEPVPAGTALPDWYRNIEPFNNPDQPNSSTVKMCRPFSDAMKIGYILRAPTDLTIRRNNQGEVVAVSKGIHSYGQTKYTDPTNSRYTFPEAKVTNPWKIRTPPGYSTLITKPLNKDILTPGLKNHAIYVPTDEYNGQIPLPISIVSDEVTIKAGTPIAQVIPLKRNRVIDEMETYSESGRPEAFEQYHRKQNLSNVRPDSYRSLFWVKKPQEVTVTEAEAEQQGFTYSVDESLPEPDEEGDFNDYKMRFITEYKNYNVIPEPVDALTYAPPWIDDFAGTIRHVNRDDGEEELLQEWMKAACSLGVLSVSHSNTTIRQKNGEIMGLSTSFDAETVKPFRRSVIGDDFPIPFALPNMLSEWLVELPKGYSNLYTEPFNHHQQYYRTFSGIVDDDVYRDKMNAPGLLVTPEEEVQIEVNTPIAQVIPFHRDSLISTGVVRK